MGSLNNKNKPSHKALGLPRNPITNHGSKDAFASYPIHKANQHTIDRALMVPPTVPKLTPIDPPVIDDTALDHLEKLLRGPTAHLEHIVIPFHPQGPKHHNPKFKPNSSEGVEFTGHTSKKIPCFHVTICQGPWASLPMINAFMICIAHCQALWVKVHSQNLWTMESSIRLGQTGHLMSIVASKQPCQWLTATALCQTRHNNPASFQNRSLAQTEPHFTSSFASPSPIP